MPVLAVLYARAMSAHHPRVFLFVALFATTATASSHQVGLQLGGAIAQLRDLNFSPTRYDGLLPSGALHYRYSRDRDRLEVSLGASGGVLANRYGYEVLRIVPAAAVAWTRQLPSSSSRWHFAAGPSLSARPSLFQFSQEDPDHVNWATAYAAGAKASGEWMLTANWSLEATATLPLVALVSRPPAWVEYDSDNPDVGYLLDRIHSAPQLVTWNRYQSGTLELAIEGAISERLTHRLAWTLELTRDAQPRPVALLDQTVSFTWMYRL